LEVIGSALVLLATCESQTSSTDGLKNQLTELARRFVEACDDLELIPVVNPSERPYPPL